MIFTDIVLCTVLRNCKKRLQHKCMVKYGLSNPKTFHILHDFIEMIQVTKLHPVKLCPRKRYET